MAVLMDLRSNATLVLETPIQLLVADLTAFFPSVVMVSLITVKNVMTEPSMEMLPMLVVLIANSLDVVTELLITFLERSAIKAHATPCLPSMAVPPTAFPTLAANQSPTTSLLTLKPCFPPPPEPTGTQAHPINPLAPKTLIGLSSPPLKLSPPTNTTNTPRPTWLGLPVASNPEMADPSTFWKSNQSAVMVLPKEMRSAITVLKTLTQPPMLAEETAEELSVETVSLTMGRFVTEPPTVRPNANSVALPMVLEVQLVPALQPEQLEPEARTPMLSLVPPLTSISPKFWLNK